MTPVEVLLHLRMLEVALLLGAFFWIVWSPVSRLRTQRLTMFGIFAIINTAAIVIAVGWAKVTLW